MHKCRVSLLLFVIGCVVAAGCSSSNPVSVAEAETMADNSSSQPIEATPQGDGENALAKTPNREMATFGAGCFWCVEAVFEEIKGVESVESGYMGGHVVNPTYEQVCTKKTGHAEVCQLTYDPSKVSYEELLEVFWQTHDPTTLNRQGADVGPQYRSVVFYHNDQQKQLAEKYKTALDQSGAFDNPIVTEITAASVFYKAEGYHQDYYAMNPSQGYCSFVIKPKLDKVRKVFSDKLKDEASE